MKLEIAPTDLASEADSSSLLALLDAYARDPMGGAKPLPADVKARLVPDLRERIARGAAVVLIARRDGAPVGIAVCFVGYSTFAARPLLNLHDLAVVPEARGLGVGQALLAAVEARARVRGCGKVTLEVREDNARARRLYEHTGFIDYAPGGERTRTLFLEKKL
jgi:ribosomal protein S18 acetylase RimI-like enzyme